MTDPAPTVAGGAPEVRTAAGSLRGSWSGGLAVFRGVRYAEPPVGSLRFAAPEPVAAWTGTRAAVQYGPRPPQLDPFDSPEAVRTESGDDWLTVNVWSPDLTPNAGLPVMVWIPGGAYAIGSSALPDYDGGRLAAGGVVLVTINYRLGMEGFAQIGGTPANRGLLDQVAALQWVQENIAFFGGDPDRVTVFGESAGGGSVAALLVMPRATGLFRRAIAQSVPGPFFSPGLADDIAAALAAELGVRATTADLSALDPSRLPAAGQAVSAKITRWRDRWGPVAYRPIPFAPVVDGDVLPIAPWQMSADQAGRVDLLVGHTRDEHRLFSLIDGVLGLVNQDHADAALAALAPGRDGAGRYRDAYPTASPEQLYELINSDWLFRMPSLHLAQAHSAAGGRSFLYELTWPAPGMDGVLGACHGLDVPLVFGNLGSGHTAMLIGDPPSPAAESLSTVIRAAWIAFATRGDPGWPAYDPERRLTQVFDTRTRVTTYPEEPSRMLWQHHSFSPLLLVDDTAPPTPSSAGVRRPVPSP